MINPESELEHIVNSAQPGDGMIEAWQRVERHIAAVDRIGRIAAQFGTSAAAAFGLLVEYPGDNFRTDDRALFCCNGPNLETDSVPFLRLGPGQEHRRSPWYQVPLRLNSVSEAAERYRQWCESQWEAQHPNTTIQYQLPDGGRGEKTLVNPFKAKAN